MHIHQRTDPAQRCQDIQHNGTCPFELTPWTPKKKRPPKPLHEKALTKNERYQLNQAAYQFPPAQPDETRYRHQHWQPKRDQVLKTLLATGATDRQIDAFTNCGAQCIVEYCAETQRYRTRANHCKCRHCAPCAAAKAGILAANLRDKLKDTRPGRYRFITLTLRHTSDPLADQIKRLYTSFRKLRKCATWHKTQTGGAAILEVKWQPQTRRWHPHLHIVSEGKYLAQAELSAAWKTATGDSHIVDIRALHSGKDAAHYVAKYVSKGTVDAVWLDTDAAQEWVCATKGVRSASTYGKWRGYKLLAKRADNKKWVRLGLLTHIHTEAKAGATWAIKVIQGILAQCQYNPHRKRGHQTS